MFRLLVSACEREKCVTIDILFVHDVRIWYANHAQATTYISNYEQIFLKQTKWDLLDDCTLLVELKPTALQLHTKCSNPCNTRLWHFPNQSWDTGSGNLDVLFAKLSTRNANHARQHLFSSLNSCFWDNRKFIKWKIAHPELDSIPWPLDCMPRFNDWYDVWYNIINYQK